MISIFRIQSPAYMEFSCTGCSLHVTVYPGAIQTVQVIQKLDIILYSSLYLLSRCAVILQAEQF